MRVKENTSQISKRCQSVIIPSVFSFRSLQQDCHKRLSFNSFFISILKHGTLIFPAVLFFFVEINAERIERIDFYDASNNYIMFINYEYDAG